MNIEDNFGAMKPIDFTLYVGVVIVLYLLFQNQILKVKDRLLEVWKNAKYNKNLTKDTVVSPDSSVRIDTIYNDSELFFRLIKSWKETKDLAEQYGSTKAVEIADEMFPYLIPKHGESNEE